jgi:hypothetical protein
MLQSFTPTISENLVFYLNRCCSEVASERSGTPLAKKFFKLFEGWPSDTGPDSYRDITLHLFGFFNESLFKANLHGYRFSISIKLFYHPNRYRSIEIHLAIVTEYRDDFF